MCNTGRQGNIRTAHFFALFLFVTVSASFGWAAKPEITIKAPADAATFLTHSPMLTICGTASYSSNTVTYALSGATTESGTATQTGYSYSDGTYRWQFPITLNPGETHVDVTVSDYRGRTATDRISITLDSPSGRTLVLWNANDFAYSQACGATMANIHLKNNGATAWTKTDVTINRSSSLDEFTAISLPNDVAFDAVRVEITDSQNSGGLSEIQLVDNGTLLTPTGTDASSYLPSYIDYSPSRVTDGITHSWEVVNTYGYWLLNIQTSGWIEVTYDAPVTPVDPNGPEISIIAPTTASTFASPSPTLTLYGSASDNTGVTKVTYTLSGATTATGEATTALMENGELRWSTPVTLNAGNTTATVTAHDTAGNTTDTTIELAYANGTGRQLVLWNANNLAHGNDRGATKGNVRLILNGSEVWRQDNIDITRAPSYDAATGIQLPIDVAFNQIRIDITNSYGASGGLSEVQMVDNGVLCAEGIVITTSSFLNSQGRFVTENLTDGITHSYQVGDTYGYWLLSNTLTGWVDITFPMPFIARAAPSIQIAEDDIATVGTAYHYQITATSNPTAYNAVGLPDGLSIDTATGAISGTPTEAGIFDVLVEATNEYGTGHAVLLLDVAPNPDANDTVLPTLSLIAPINAPTFTTPSPSLTLCGKAGDNTGITEISYRLTGATTASGIATSGISSDGVLRWSVALTLNIGTTTALVKAKDAAGNVAQKAIALTYEGYDSPTLVIWNGNNLMHGDDRGTLTANVALKMNGAEVWRKENLAITRQVGFDAATAIPLSTMQSFDEIRVEATVPHGASVGLSELQLIVDNQVVSAGASVAASSFLNSSGRFVTEHVTDGITHSLEIAGTYGYWLPANGGSNWVSVLLPNTITATAGTGSGSATLAAPAEVDQDTIANVQVQAPDVAAADVYLALISKDGEYFATCNESGEFQENSFVPVKRNWSGTEIAQTLFSDIVPPMPSGQYQWVVVFVDANKVPLDTSHWQGILTQDVSIQTNAALYLNQQIYSMGDKIELQLTVPPLENADVYLGLTIPGESAPLYYVALQQFQAAPQPIARNITIGGLHHLTVFVLPIWTEIPAGEYRWDLVITPTGGGLESALHTTSCVFVVE